MLPENLRGGGRCVKAMHILGMDIRTGVEQQLHNLPLIGVGGGMQRGCAPMVIVILHLHIGTGREQENYDIPMSLPDRAL